VFALTIAGLCLLATAAATLLASAETSTRLRSEIGADLVELAHHLADTLDRGMFERWRDMQVAASLDTMRDPNLPAAAKRVVIERMRATYPDYAAIGLMDPNGRVLTATVPSLVGADVSSREFFTEGRQRPYVGDVHDAALLAKILGDDPANPPRFVDIAAPVRAEDGSLVGVIGAHLYWHWAEEMQQALVQAARMRHPAIEVLVLARDGTVLLGPRPLLRGRLDLESAKAVADGQSGSRVEPWPDGQAYLTGFHRTRGYRDYPGLGWSVLVRQSAEVSFEPVGLVQRRIALWGGLVALVAALLGWLAAGVIVQPLRLLADAAGRLGRGEALGMPKASSREIQQLADALACAADQLGAKDRRQGLLIDELNHRVKNTLMTVQAMAVLSARSAQSPEAYKNGLQARIVALSRTHNLLNEAAWEAISLRDLLRNELEPYDDGSGRVALEGPPVALAPAVAVSLGMAAHELVTNAVKHGSLSVPGGRVELRWSLTKEAGREGRLHVVWKETGGPEVVHPVRRGFGSLVLGQGLARDNHVETHLDFKVEGLACTMLVSLAAASEAINADTRDAMLRNAA
jgi:two-component sensor histidine kinase